MFPGAEQLVKEPAVETLQVNVNKRVPHLFVVGLSYFSSPGAVAVRLHRSEGPSVGGNRHIRALYHDQGHTGGIECYLPFCAQPFG